MFPPKHEKKSWAHADAQYIESLQPATLSSTTQATWRPCTSRTAPTRALSRPDGMLPPCYLVRPHIDPADQLAPCRRISYDLAAAALRLRLLLALLA